MALRYIVVIAACIIAVANSVSVCGPNSEYRQCGTACPATCGKAYPSPCTKQCVTGCFCKPGFIKSRDGECMDERDCLEGLPMKEIDAGRPTCSEREMFLECGSACVPTCNNPVPDPHCTKQCVRGCFCKPGFIKSPEGECVDERDCLRPMKISASSRPTCPAKEKFLPCGSACVATCENPHPSPICTKQCVIGCFCMEGHLRDGDGSCVLAHQCKTKPTKTCPTDREVYVENDGAMLNCYLSCKPLISGGNGCVSGVPACVCKRPYVRNATGQCVEEDQCQADA